MGLTMASGPRSGGRASRPPLRFLALTVLAAGLATGAYLVTPSPQSGRVQPAGTSRPVDGRNLHDAALKNDYLYDSGYETCQALGLRALARLVGRPARPGLVAAAFARRFDPQDRQGPLAGCLKGLTEPTAVAGDARARN